MSRDMRFLESPGTPEDDAYRYRIEWDDRASSIEETMRTGKVKNYGPGSREVSGFDNAWDVYNDYRKDPILKHVRLVKLDKDGNICSVWD